MLWIVIIFIISAGVVFISGVKLSRYGEAIAVNTKLGGLWVGSVILAGATSLPEMVTSISSGVLNLPDIALGNVFGSNIFNVIIIAVMDIVERKSAIFTKISPGHILAATYGMLLAAIAAIFILLKLKAAVFGVGIDAMLLAIIYFIGLRTISRYEQKPREEKLVYLADGIVAEARETKADITLVKAIRGLALNALLIIGGGIFLSYSAGEIADITGVGATFIGSILVSLVTSLPELVSCIAAVKIGAIDMAVGNVLGSNIFNIFTIFISDLAYRGGPILSIGSSLHAVTALFGLVLSGVVILGLSYRSKKQYAGVGIDSIIIIAIYLIAVYILFQR
ncbi:MAG: sodium:calcium antiporter [Firmicutes bacterium]|nr:sodium:calcium antiporter [Bacillota bacterium]